MATTKSMDLLVRFQGSLSKVTDSQLVVPPDRHKYPCNPALYVLVGHIYSRLRKIFIVPAVVCK